jgi:thioredoxin reductase (NADPH)
MLLRDLIVVGAGPAGLATAIAAQRAGIDYEVVEQGVLVNSLSRFPVNMVYFTTPELLEIGGLPFVSPYEKPTRVEALRYYRRVADTYRLCITFDERVLNMYREPDLPPGGTWAIETRSRHGVRRVRHARALVVATGCYDHPNLLQVDGEDLPHVSHYYTEAHPFYRKDVVIVGGKNSAAEAALDLFRAGARVTLVHRHAGLSDSIKYWVRPDIENRIKEGSIATYFEACVVEIRPRALVIDRHGERIELPADAVFLLTGYHADVDLLRRAGVRIDPTTLAPEHDPETFETNLPNLFVAGSVVSGRQSGKIFIENGRFHGETVVRVIARRLGNTVVSNP